MDDPKKRLKGKLIFTFVSVLILIILASLLGWYLALQVEKSEKVIETSHLMREAQLELRREEKNLLIRGFLERRFDRWEKNMVEFNKRFDELIAMGALNEEEIKDIRTNASEMSNIFNKFVADIQSHRLNENEIVQYDDGFKIIGRKALEMSEKIVNQKHEIAESITLRTNMLIIVFAVLFIAIGFFLALNILKLL